MDISALERSAKLQRIAADEGFADVESLLAWAAREASCPGICVDPDCGRSCSHIEPDQRHGYCDHCGGETIVSCLVLAGLL